VLASRLSAALVERASFDVMFSGTTSEHIYVVGRYHEEIRGRAGASCFVQEGMLTIKLKEGERHPFIRALGPECKSMVDGTLGLANDALHAATMKKCTVLGIEGSVVIHSLLEEGLPRLSRTYESASLISLRFGSTLDVLRGLPTASMDVVVLDPMMSRPRKSAPSFLLLREFAVHERVSPEVLIEAERVARHRVVLKIGKGAPLPADAPYAFEDHELGAHVVYWVHHTHQSHQTHQTHHGSKQGSSI